MFQFPGCPSLELWIHSRMTGHCSRRVSPFRYLRIYACLRLPVAFRSLPRLSSASSALASTLCPSLFDLPIRSFDLPETINLLASGFFFTCSLRLRCAVFKVRAGSARFHLASRRFGGAISRDLRSDCSPRDRQNDEAEMGLKDVLDNVRRDPSKRYR